MNGFINTLINWSEVWSLIIPLTVIFVHRPKEPAVKPFILYVCLALLLNSIATIMVEFYFSMPSYLKNNNILYNIHSFIRVLCFGWYIISILPKRQANTYKGLLAGYIILVLINFAIFQSPFFLSSRLFVAESIILLVFCLSYYLQALKDDSETNWIDQPSFIFITGISLYETVSFFIFLFFYILAENNPEFGNTTITINMITFLVLCIFLALGLNRSARPTARPQSDPY